MPVQRAQPQGGCRTRASVTSTDSWVADYHPGHASLSQRPSVSVPSPFPAGDPPYTVPALRTTLPNAGLVHVPKTKPVGLIRCRRRWKGLAAPDLRKGTEGGRQCLEEQDPPPCDTEPSAKSS